VYKPLVVCKEGGKYVVLGGNMRIRALKELGFKEVDISVVKAKTEKEKIEYALSDNDRVGYYEEEKLAELIQPHLDEISLEDFKVDVGEPLDLRTVYERFGPDLDERADEIPEIDDSPAITKQGDLFTLGKHRLMCGDSTKADDVARLMKGGKAALCLTDPPYGISYDASHSKYKNGISRPRIIGDDDLYNPNPILSLGINSIIWGGNCFASKLPDFSAWLIWVKTNRDNANIRQADAELAWTNCITRNRVFHHLWIGAYKKSESGERAKHPTQKPVALMKWCIELMPKAGLILDLYIGSGTTLIAAEKTGRICYGMEIDPKYCDVIIKRYADYVGISEESIRVTRENPNG
jgi:DNA modification methylase